MSTQTKTAGDKLNDALKEADDAAKELKAMGKDVKSAIKEDTTSIKAVLGETNVARSLEKARDKVVEVAGPTLDKAKELGEKMDESVNAKPYHYIAGAAAAALILGILISRKS